jgi:hypothetical protein
VVLGRNVNLSNLFWVSSGAQILLLAPPPLGGTVEVAMCHCWVSYCLPSTRMRKGSCFHLGPIKKYYLGWDGRGRMQDQWEPSEMLKWLVGLCDGVLIWADLFQDFPKSPSWRIHCDLVY